MNRAHKVASALAIAGPATLLLIRIHLISAPGFFNGWIRSIEGKPTESFATQLSMIHWALGLAVASFTLGMLWLWLLARRTGIYSKKDWNLLLGASIAMSILGGNGFGLLAILALFVVPTFRKMKAVEHSLAHVLRT